MSERRLQFVGGRLDGQVLPASHDRAYFDTFRAVRYSFDGPGPEGSPDPVFYQERSAPTGEQVMLLKGTRWPDRFDTEVWPQRRYTGWATWRRLEPWLWRGDNNPDHPWCAQYVLGSPARPGELLSYAQVVELEHIPDRELAMAALTGERTLADVIIEHLRGAITWELTPPCPVRACEGKAAERLTAAAPVHLLHGALMRPPELLPAGGSTLPDSFRFGGPPRALWPGDVVYLCPRHASEESRRISYNGPSASFWKVGL